MDAPLRLAFEWVVSRKALADYLALGAGARESVRGGDEWMPEEMRGR